MVRLTCPVPSKGCALEFSWYSRKRYTYIALHIRWTCLCKMLYVRYLLCVTSCSVCAIWQPLRVAVQKDSTHSRQSHRAWRSTTQFPRSRSVLRGGQWDLQLAALRSYAVILPFLSEVATMATVGDSASKAGGLLSQFENGHTLMALVVMCLAWLMHWAAHCSRQELLCVVAWKLCNTHWHSCVGWDQKILQ